MANLSTPAVGEFLVQVDNMLARRNWNLDITGPHRDALACALNVLDRLNHPVPDHLLDAFAGAMGEMVRQEAAGAASWKNPGVERAAIAIQLLRPAIEGGGQLEQGQILDLVHRTLVVLAVIMRRIAFDQYNGIDFNTTGPSPGIAAASRNSSARADEILSRNQLTVSGHSPHRAVLAHGLDALDALNSPAPEVLFDAFAGAARRVAEAEQTGVYGLDGAAAERVVLVGLRLDCEAEEAGALDADRALEISQMTLAVAILILCRMAQENSAVE